MPSTCHPDKLPPLPVPYISRLSANLILGPNIDEEFYSASQMRAYAAEAVAAERERQQSEKPQLDAAVKDLEAQVKKLQAELKRCGKDNCMGRLSSKVTNWVTESAKNAAVAAERERCIKACRTAVYGRVGSATMRQVADWCAEEIASGRQPLSGA